MTNRHKIALAIAATLLATPLVAADSSGCGTTTVDKPSTSSGKQQKAQLGDTLTLKGTDDKTRMKVKAIKVIDPVSAGEFDQPDHGKRYVGVEVRLRNVGQATYQDSPSNGAHLITSGDEQADSTILSQGPCSSSFASDATIAPGDGRKGCIPFQVPTHARVAKFQFQLDSGFGPQSGEWRVR
jgi:hypothetical protein